MRTTLLFILTLSVFALSFCIWWEVSEPQIVSAITERPTPAMEHKLKKATRYHGTMTAYRTIEGKWYFDRDCKRCRLFTEGFLESYNNHPPAKLGSTESQRASELKSR